MATGAPAAQSNATAQLRRDAAATGAAPIAPMLASSMGVRWRRRNLEGLESYVEARAGHLMRHAGRMVLEVANSEQRQHAGGIQLNGRHFHCIHRARNHRCCDYGSHGSGPTGRADGIDCHERWHGGNLRSRGHLRHRPGSVRDGDGYVRVLEQHHSVLPQAALVGGGNIPGRHLRMGLVTQCRYSAIQCDYEQPGAGFDHVGWKRRHGAHLGRRAI